MREVLLLPASERRQEAVEQFARDVEPLGPDSSREDQVAASVGTIIAGATHGDAEPAPLEPADTGPKEARSHDAIEVPHHPLIAAALEAIWHGGVRARDKSGGWTEHWGLPSFSRTGSRRGRINIYFDPASVEGSRDIRCALWESVESLSALTSDVFVSFLAELVPRRGADGGRRSLEEPVVISVDRLLEYKGGRAPASSLLAKRVIEEVERLSALRFDSEDGPAREGAVDDRGDGHLSRRGEPFFECVRLEHSESGKDHRHTSWLVRPGRWARAWFDPGAGNRTRSVPRRLVALDHRQTRGSSVLAKKLGMNILLIHGMSGSSRPFESTVVELLSTVGELLRPKRRERQWAGRVRERFDEAMLTLEQAGVFASVAWPDGFGPGDPDRYRGWVDRWLSARIRVHLAFDPERCPRRKEPGGTKAGHRLDGYPNLRALRTECGWTQTTLAKYLGISPSLLSNIENGRTAPSKELSRKIERWLAERNFAAGDWSSEEPGGRRPGNRINPKRRPRRRVL